MNFEADDQNKIMDHLMTFFKHDINKVCLWLMTQNPILGDIAPVVMIRMGWASKVLKLTEGLK